MSYIHTYKHTYIVSSESAAAAVSPDLTATQPITGIQSTLIYINSYMHTHTYIHTYIPYLTMWR